MSEGDRYIGKSITEVLTRECGERTMDIVSEVRGELHGAIRKHGPMKSAHEAYSVILEELDEAWTEIKAQQVDRAALRKELIQVAAMACRAILDLKL